MNSQQISHGGMFLSSQKRFQIHDQLGIPSLQPIQTHTSRCSSTGCGRDYLSPAEFAYPKAMARMPFQVSVSADFNAANRTGSQQSPPKLQFVHQNGTN